MRDPMNWALPLYRAFDIQVRVHVLFFIVTLGLFLREVADKHSPIAWTDVLFFTILLLFVIILLHEYGHCYGARRVNGDAKEILIWPLGGLASVDVPNDWKANLITVLAGPAVNLFLCLACAIGLAFGGFLPNVNPISNPYNSEIYNFRDGIIYTSPYGLRPYKLSTAEPIPRELVDQVTRQKDGPRDKHSFPPALADEIAHALGGERHIAPAWAVWLNRAFWLSGVLLLLNLLPAYPLDGGQILMCLVWARSTQRQGVVTAAYSGFVVGVIFLIIGIATNEVLFALLGLFMLQMSYLKLNAPEVEEGIFGYDFSAGYTSLERDEEPTPRRRRPGFLARWWQARKMRKLLQEHEQRQREEERVDQLLDKIARFGKQSLTEEEQRFLERASSRYRNRS